MSDFVGDLSDFRINLLAFGVFAVAIGSSSYSVGGSFSHHFQHIWEMGCLEGFILICLRCKMLSSNGNHRIAPDA